MMGDGWHADKWLRVGCGGDGGQTDKWLRVAWKEMVGSAHTVMTIPW